MAPASTDDCDVGTPGDAACGADLQSGCLGCAVAGSCKPVYDTCVGDQECLDFNTAIQDCPQ